MTELIQYNTLEDLPVKPKRFLTNFFMYKKEVFSQRRAEYPNLSVPEITAKISQEYKDMKEEVNQKYTNTYKKQKDEYDRLIAEWREKYGEIERVLRVKLKKEENKKKAMIKKQQRKIQDIQTIFESKQEINLEENDFRTESNEIIRSIKKEKEHLNIRYEKALNMIKELQKKNEALTQENKSLKIQSQMRERIDFEDSTQIEY